MSVYKAFLAKAHWLFFPGIIHKFCLCYLIFHSAVLVVIALIATCAAGQETGQKWRQSGRAMFTDLRCSESLLQHNFLSIIFICVVLAVI